MQAQVPPGAPGQKQHFARAQVICVHRIDRPVQSQLSACGPSVSPLKCLPAGPGPRERPRGDGYAYSEELWGSRVPPDPRAEL